MKEQFDRRAFLKVLGWTSFTFVASAALPGVSSAAALTACEKITDKDKLANTKIMVGALKYVPASKTKGQKCDGCIQYTADATSKKNGTCKVLTGCSVSAGGWCASWSKKA
jgi:hypothetical protein